MDIVFPYKRQQTTNISPTRKTHTIQVVAVTDEQRALIEEGARKENRSLSNYLLHAGLSRAQEEVSQ